MRHIPEPAMIEDLMRASGLSKRLCFKEVRKGNLPGRIVSGKYSCPWGEFQQYIDGQWSQRQTKSIDFIKHRPT